MSCEHSHACLVAAKWLPLVLSVLGALRMCGCIRPHTAPVLCGPGDVAETDVSCCLCRHRGSQPSPASKDAPCSRTATLGVKGVCRGDAQVAALAAGDAHSAALTANGFLFTWGSNDRGQLGLPAVAEVAAQVCKPQDPRVS